MSRAIAIPLLMLALVFALPRYVEGTADETGRGAGDNGAVNMNGPDSYEQIPWGLAPNSNFSPAAPEEPQRNDNPPQDGTTGNPDQQDE